MYISSLFHLDALRACKFVTEIIIFRLRLPEASHLMEEMIFEVEGLLTACLLLFWSIESFQMSYYLCQDPVLYIVYFVDVIASWNADFF